MNKIQSTSIDGDGKPYFYALSSEEIFDKTFDPDRDPENLKRMAEYHCFRLTGGNSPENMAKTEQTIRNILMASNAYRDYYLFKDRVHSKN